jgi:hypothetical protein
MIMYKKLVVVCVVAFVSGCASYRPIQPERTQINFPEANTTTTKELGDTLLLKLHEFKNDAIEVFNPISVSILTYPAGTYVAMGESDDGNLVFYEANIMSSLGYSPRKGGFAIPKSNHEGRINNVIGWQVSPKNGWAETDKSISFLRKKSRQLGLPFLKLELIYNGKVGSNIKFLYRELSNNMMRTPFTQDIQYDLNESKTIGFKGARIDIIKATNRQIEYIVRKPFP